MTEPENTDTDPAPTPAPEIKYASFNVRIIAATIDLFIIMLFAAPTINWLMNILFSPLDSNALMAVASQPDILQNPGKYIPSILGEIKKQHIIERSVLDNLLQLVCIAGYTLPFWFRYSATPGKLLFRIQIQDATTQLPMTRKQAIERFFGYIVSFIPFTLGFLWMIFNKKHRGFHDMIADTVVIVKPKKPKD